MHHSSATGQRAAGAAGLSGRPIGPTPPARRRTLSIADRLDTFSMQLDELIRDCRCFPNATSHREVERRIAEAEEIAAGIRAVFRSPSAENSPGWQDGKGKAIW